MCLTDGVIWEDFAREMRLLWLDDDGTAARAHHDNGADKACPHTYDGDDDGRDAPRQRLTLLPRERRLRIDRWRRWRWWRWWR